MTRAATALAALLAAGAAALAAAEEAPVPSAGGTDPGGRVIYGADDRMDAWEVAGTVLAPLLRSEVALFLENDGYLNPVPGGYEIDSPLTLAQRVSPLCPGEPYATQPVAADCSGFLVGPDLVATAGHCIPQNGRCDKIIAVFGFHMLDAATPASFVPDENVYPCAEVLTRVRTSTDDYAILRLDRAVTGHMPLPLRPAGAVESDPDVAGLLVLGHPMGIPVKVAGGAVVKGAHLEFFEANLDTYVGNSGSAVVSVDLQGRPLHLEGILVRGNTDWVWTGSCYASNVCPDTSGCGGQWEEVTRADRFSSWVPLPPAPGAVPDGWQIPGAGLGLSLLPTGDLLLEWEPSCAPGDRDFVVYEGALGGFASHLPLACTTAGATSLQFTPPGGDAYYLVAPRTALREGSLGLRGDATERPRGPFPCLVRETGGCP